MVTGRIEIFPGCWVALGRDLIWRGDVDPTLLATMNRRFKPRARGPAEGWPGYEEVEAAARFFGVRWEVSPFPEIPPDAVH